MRPHRDATPILLVLVAALFVLVAFIEIRDLVAAQAVGARVRRPRPGAELVPVGERVLAEGRRKLAARINDPGDSLFGALRTLEVDSHSREFTIPVTVPEAILQPEDQSPATLESSGVRAEWERHSPFLEGDLPHAGEFRFQVTFDRASRPLIRRVVMHPYRLVRLGPPAPLASRGLVVVDVESVLDPEGGADFAATRRDRATALEDLENLRVARTALVEQVQEVAAQFSEFVHGFRHVGGRGVGPPEALAADWILGIPQVPHAPARVVGEVDARLAAGVSELVIGPHEAGLAEWGRFREWGGILANQGEQLRRSSHLSWERWRAAVEQVFDPAGWENLGGAEAMDRHVRACRLRIQAALVALGEVWSRRAAADLQLLHHYRRILERFMPLDATARADLQRARGRLATDSWKAQARHSFLGEAAASRCLRFLESAAGPFAKEFDGVVFVDNAGQEPLVLGETTFPGRLVLVATGEVRLANLGPRDSARHHLTVQADGPMQLGGRVRAYLIARGGLRMAPDTQVVGGLLVEDLGADGRLDGNVRWDPSFSDDDPRLRLWVELGPSVRPGSLEPKAGKAPSAASQP